MNQLYQIKWILLTLVFVSSAVSATPVNRTVLVLCDGPSDHIQNQQAHTLLEMPLNFLGLRLQYHNFHEGLPTLTTNDGIRGILTCFESGMSLPDPVAYTEWCSAAVKMDKKLVIIGNPGLERDKHGLQVSSRVFNRLFRHLGMSVTGLWNTLTYDVEVVTEDKEMIAFERPLEDVFPPFLITKVTNKRGKSHLQVCRTSEPDQAADLVVTGAKGGYIAEGYFLHWGSGESPVRQWYINPFRFFAEAFDTNELPKLETVILGGRRIYYSHIDGDGWNNVSRCEKWTERPTLSAEVVLQEAIIPYPDLPVTVAPIAADLDKNWVGTKESEAIAKEIFALPQVEVGSHTYSHPFCWEFFKEYSPDRERPFLPKYKYGRWDKKSAAEWLGYMKGLIVDKKNADTSEKLLEGYDTPRAFANFQFDIEKEIEGSVLYIQELLPPGKKVSCLMWSGDTSPFEDALIRVRKIGIGNINGGDSRFDQRFPSYAWVAPLGRQVGKEKIIYASNSNENTYTELWTGNFFGFKHLIGSLKRTAVPILLKPANVYYHIYSGEREASLHALKSNLDYIRTLSITPVAASHYIEIANGFYSGELEELAHNKWKVSNRKRLQTVRFDRASSRAINWQEAKGVIGQRYLHGALYVYLDEAVEEPIIALYDHKVVGSYPEGPCPYLVDSRWPVWNLQRDGGKLTFSTGGYGLGEQHWRIPEGSSITVSKGKVNTENSIATLTIDGTAPAEVLSVTLQWEVGGSSSRPTEE